MSSSTFTAKDGTQIYYKDWGAGQPIVFHHGWPLSSDDCDAQTLFFLAQGYRVIAHDRRGHGRSSQTGALQEVVGLAALGRLKIPVDRYPLSGAKQAYDDIEHGRLIGRAVLIPATPEHSLQTPH